MCGGPWLNTTMRVSCGLQWGAWFLLLFGVGSAGYVVVGVRGPWSRGSAAGLPVRQALAVHPHYSRWVELAGLAADGAAYVKARQSGRPMPPRGRQQQEEAQERRGDSTRRDTGPGGGEGGGGERKEKRSSGGSRSKSKSLSSKERGGKGDLKEALVSAAAAQSGPAGAAAAPAPAPVAGTSAGGGGRWVHLPN